MSRLKTGGYAPLFDRLEQPADKEEEIAQWLNITLLEKSVFNELNRISQTRSRLNLNEYLEKKTLTVLDYGLPDFYGNSIQNSDSRNKINQILEKCFAFFEPRLRNIKTQVIVDNKSKSELKFRISGNIKHDESLEPVTFLILSKDKIINGSSEESVLVDK